MKKNLRMFAVAAVAWLLLSVTSCRKIEEALLKDPTADYKLCNIKRITYRDFFSPGGVFEAVFTYNAYGNPVSVISNHVIDGEPNVMFRYDSKQRLTDYIGYFPNNAFEFWKHYYYDADGRVFKDSTFTFGSVSPSPTPSYFLFSRETFYEYDFQGRISKTSDGSEYNYDEKGNLDLGFSKLGLPYPYDDKVNFLRTNKVWMFIERNYSRNNSFHADYYNNHWLPVKYTSAHPEIPLYGKVGFMEKSMISPVFEYMCD